MKVTRISVHWSVLALSALGLTIPASGQVPADSFGTIQVTVAGVRVDQGGVLVLGLYRGKGGWLKLDSAVVKQVVPANADSVSVTFDHVPLGPSYAVQVFHDKNQNGKLDFRWFPFPKPKEGAGVSNNNERKGPPYYDKAAFPLTEPWHPIRIILRY